MTWLREWVQTILVLVLFAGFLELLLPSDTMKRFVQVVVGLFILSAILGPLVALTENLRQGPAFALPAIRKPDTMQVVRRGEELARRQREEVLQAYRDNVARQVVSLVELDGSCKVVAVQVEVEEGVDKPTFGQLLSLRLTLEPSPGVPAYDPGKLAELLANFYGLPPDRVTIDTVQRRIGDGTRREE